MSTSLPAYLHQVLQEQALESGAPDDAETRQLMERLENLNERVESAKQAILAKRQQKQDS